MENKVTSFGEALPDQVERISSLFDSHLELVDEIRELHKERIVLERDYAAKLQALAKKADEKKARLQPAIVVGEEPTKSWDQNTLKQSTLNSAYSLLIQSWQDIAQDHIDVAESLSAQVILPLKNIERKSGEQKKKAMLFFQKLLADRDRAYADRIKSKQKYDDECAEVEVHRQKQNRAQDDRHAERAARHADQQRADMLNSKNSYLISMAIANQAKTKFYSEDLPALEDELQMLQTQLTQRFTKVLSHSQALQISQLDAIKGRLASVEQMCKDVNPTADQAIYIDHNIRPFSCPNDWSFEPCVSHYDTDQVSIESAPKVFLQNKLAKCRTKLNDLIPLLESKRKELDQLSKLVEAYTADKSLGNVDEVTDNYLDVKHQLTFSSTAERLLNTEVEVIVLAVGDDEGAQQPHKFKSSSFSIPTQCGYCKSSIWGLSKQGKTCKACGLSVHSKCELKVPAECPGSADGGHGSTMTRHSTNASSFTTGRSSIEKVSPTVSTFAVNSAQDEHEPTFPSARALFDFTPTSEFELDITDGDTLYVVEPDDGSGWVKVSKHPKARSQAGLVPASYVEVLEDETEPAAAGKGSGTAVRALYDYQAQGDDEIPLKEGEVLTLTSGPSGGQNYADGWWEGTDARGKRGIFPSNYVTVL